MKEHYVDGVFNDRNFLMDPNSWPRMQLGNFCCLKRKNKDDKAFILTLDNPTMNGKINVSLGYFADGGTGEVITYDSVDQLLEDGWYVD